MSCIAVIRFTEDVFPSERVQRGRVLTISWRRTSLDEELQECSYCEPFDFVNFQSRFSDTVDWMYIGMYRLGFNSKPTSATSSVQPFTSYNNRLQL